MKLVIAMLFAVITLSGCEDVSQVCTDPATVKEIVAIQGDRSIIRLTDGREYIGYLEYVHPGSPHCMKWEYK